TLESLLDAMPNPSLHSPVLAARRPDRSSAPVQSAEGDIALPPGGRIDGFTLGEELGQGGFSRVWSARREEDGSLAAVKISHARGAVLMERFRREASALARIGPPHVARFYRLGKLDDDRPYIAMERLFGQTLSEELRELSTPPALSWAVR